MLKAKAAARTKKAAQAPTGGGYRKGEETRQRILEVALKAFGEAPFKVVTTRQIANEADVSLPTLQYYFGDKDGLYRACAESLVTHYRRRMRDAAAEANEALDHSCTPELAKTHLKSLVGALAELLVGSSDVQRWAQFVTRELREPGPTFELLYEKLWQPGIETTSRLIARIRGKQRSDEASRIQALLLISSLLAFQPGRSISLRAMGWSKIGPKELGLVLARLDAQINEIAL